MSRRNRNRDLADRQPRERKIDFEPHGPVMTAVHDLAEVGIFGETAHEVIERLVCDRLQDLAQDGWLDIDGLPTGGVD